MAKEQIFWKIQRFRGKAAFSPKGENGAASLREAKARKRPSLQHSTTMVKKEIFNLSKLF